MNLKEKKVWVLFKVNFTECTLWYMIKPDFDY